MTGWVLTLSYNAELEMKKQARRKKTKELHHQKTVISEGSRIGPRKRRTTKNEKRRGIS